MTDSIQDVMFKLSEGNPGALRVCLEALQQTEEIDPDNAMGGLGILMDFDTLGLYGAKIWMLAKDVCGQDLPKMIALLRGWQLGFVSAEKVRHAVENRGEGINLEEICAKVCERLPRFKLTASV